MATAKAAPSEDTFRKAALMLREMGASKVYVFGSAARGELRPGSDIDIAVEGLPSSRYFSAARKAWDLFGLPVDLVDLDDKTPFVRFLLQSGELVLVR